MFVNEFLSGDEIVFSVDLIVINEAVKISGMQKGEKIYYDDGVVKEPAVSGRYELYFEKYPNAFQILQDLIPHL